MSKIEFIKNGNIFATKLQALICPVNCLGIMGAGLAKAFRDNNDFTDQNKSYKEACHTGVLAPGSIFVAPSDKTKTVIYFVTKMDWRDPSKMEWIENGLCNLYTALTFYKIPSVAIPGIGAGLGGLPWPPIEFMIKGLFESSDKTIEVYCPI